MVGNILDVVFRQRTLKERIRSLRREDLVHDHSIAPYLNSPLKKIESGSRAKISC